MAYIPSFEHDIFISYAHADNETSRVSAFHRDLVQRLTIRLGARAFHKPKEWIFFDRFGLVNRIELAGFALQVRFSRDGQWLEIIHYASVDNDIIYARYPLDPQELLREACEKVTRNLTVAEWKRYAGQEIPYKRTCEKLPFPPDYKAQ